MQLISFYYEVFQKEKLDLWLQPYRLLSTSKTTGLIQVRCERCVNEPQIATVVMMEPAFAILRCHTVTAQVLDNSISLHGLKKKDDYPGSLAKHFERLYGAPGSEALAQVRPSAAAA